MNDLQQLLISGLPLWMTIDGFRQAMLSVFQSGIDSTVFPKSETSLVLTKSELEYLKSHSWYQLSVHKELETLLRQMISDIDISVTDDFCSVELPENSIAYHRVWGTITADSNWWFSSKQMEIDLLEAESNPMITSHLIHINSPGGEAWYLDRLSETLRNCRKPIITLYEKMCCSAAYYIGCHGSRVYATTHNDYVGCIGTMCSFYDFEPYFKKLGITKVEAKADGSDLKNKTFDDLIDGKSEKYIHDFLNPLNEQFHNVVRLSRSKLEKLDDSEPVMRGETFCTDSAIEIGLADGLRTFSSAVEEIYAMGLNFSKNEKLKESLYNIV